MGVSGLWVMAGLWEGYGVKSLSILRVIRIKVMGPL